MEYIVKILSVEQITHDVKAFRITKPEGYVFEPGHATEVSINKTGWENEKRPFTFTSLNEWPWLEFTIKIYKDHQGVTNQLDSLKPGDELIIGDVWGAISYKGEGYFIAGGAGITPFIAILRKLRKDGQLGNNKLFFSNKTAADIILRNELDEMLGNQVEHVVTAENNNANASGYIDRSFLKERITDLTKPVYICGPDKMISDINDILLELGAKPEAVIFEK